MTPAEYFPEAYRADLRVFAQRAIPEHGPFWMLCGMTLGGLFDPHRRGLYQDAAGFVCSVYALNLLDQALHCYFPGVHARWLAASEPFPDVRECSYGHGGVGFIPGSVLRFARDPGYIPRAEPIAITDERLADFTQLVFERYLSPESEPALRRSIQSQLVDRLLQDPDCPEFAEFWRSTPAVA